MGNMVTIHHVVIPVALALLKNGGLETKCASPRPGLGSRARKGKLSLIAIPRTYEMDRLDIGRGAEREAEL